MSIQASWTENQNITFDDGTPAREVEGVGNIDLAASGYIGVVVQVQIAFGASADGNAQIRIRSSPDSGTTKDTELLFSQEVEYAASTTKRLSIPIMNQPFVEIGVYNGNAVVEDITISAKYAGLKYATS